MCMGKKHTNSEFTSTHKEVIRIAVTLETLLREKLRLEKRLILANPKPISESRVIQYVTVNANRPGGSKSVKQVLEKYGLTENVSTG